MVSGVGRNSSGHLNWNWRFLARGTIMMEKIWWNYFWYLYPDINYVIDGTKCDFFRAKDDCRRTR